MKKEFPIRDLQFHSRMLREGPLDPDDYTPAQLSIWRRWHKRAITQIRRARVRGTKLPDTIIIEIKDQTNDDEPLCSDDCQG